MNHVSCANGARARLAAAKVLLDDATFARRLIMCFRLFT
jgi:hypothetical protein